MLKDIKKTNFRFGYINFYFSISQLMKYRRHFRQEHAVYHFQFHYHHITDSYPASFMNLNRHVSIIAPNIYLSAFSPIVASKTCLRLKKIKTTKV